jgi:hypothetical protein
MRFSTVVNHTAGLVSDHRKRNEEKGSEVIGTCYA